MSNDSMTLKQIGEILHEEREDEILCKPVGTWFSCMRLPVWSWLKAQAVAGNYRRPTDGAILIAHPERQFMFSWQVKKEEDMDITNTINWSEMTSVMRDALVSVHVMPDQPLQHYTTDMKAAWSVVEHFGNAVINITHVPGAFHHCRIKPFTNGRAYHGFRLNAPEAICVAALRAAGLTVLHSEEDIIGLHRDLAND